MGSVELGAVLSIQKRLQEAIRLTDASKRLRRISDCLNMADAMGVTAQLCPHVMAQCRMALARPMGKNDVLDPDDLWDDTIILNDRTN